MRVLCYFPTQYLVSTMTSCTALCSYTFPPPHPTPPHPYKPRVKAASWTLFMLLGRRQVSHLQGTMKWSWIRNFRMMSPTAQGLTAWVAGSAWNPPHTHTPLHPLTDLYGGLPSKERTAKEGSAKEGSAVLNMSRVMLEHGRVVLQLSPSLVEGSQPVMFMTLGRLWHTSWLTVMLNCPVTWHCQPPQLEWTTRWTVDAVVVNTCCAHAYSRASVSPVNIHQIIFRHAVFITSTCKYTIRSSSDTQCSL